MGDGRAAVGDFRSHTGEQDSVIRDCRAVIRDDCIDKSNGCAAIRDNRAVMSNWCAIIGDWCAEIGESWGSFQSRRQLCHAEETPVPLWETLRVDSRAKIGDYRATMKEFPFLCTETMHA